jgi:hypothetical protein
VDPRRKQPGLGEKQKQEEEYKKERKKRIDYLTTL